MRARRCSRDGRRPQVVMQVFQKKDSYLGGVDEAIAILKLCADDWDALTVRRSTTATGSSRTRRC